MTPSEAKRRLQVSLGRALAATTSRASDQDELQDWINERIEREMKMSEEEIATEKAETAAAIQAQVDANDGYIILLLDNEEFSRLAYEGTVNRGIRPSESTEAKASQ